MGDRQERARVYHKIAPLIRRYAMTNADRMFHAEDLRQYVLYHEPDIAPDSPGRILRELRLGGELDYVVINRRDSLYQFRKPKMKPFQWSWSKLKNWRNCPKKHWHVEIRKDFKEEEGEALKWGHEVHASMADRIAKGKPLPKSMAGYDEWARRVISLRPEMEIMVEQKLAMANDFTKTGYFDGNTWFRCVADALAISKRNGLAITYDWKTGKVEPDYEQLGLSAQVIFAHYPEVHTVGTSFIWLAHDDETQRIYRREDMAQFWNGLWPEVKKLTLAHATTDYPPKRSGLCVRHCPVTICPYHGKRPNE